MPRLALLLLLVPLACDRPDEASQAQAQALEAATAELRAARASLEAERTAMQGELVALREAVDAANAKLDALAVPRQPPPQPLPTPDASLDAGFPMFSGEPSADEEALLAAVRCASEGRCSIDRAFLETLLINPAGLAKQARVVPKIAESGAVEGYKLYGIRRGSLPRALGLKNGDLVGSVDGKPLASLEEAMTTFTKLRGAKSFTLGIVRKGAPFSLTIDIVEP
jgi:hypothetical protein